MQKKRVISFLPSATELIYELGAQEKLFGVTHECNYPSDARNKPKVIESVFEPENMSSLEIDKKICDLSEKGEDIYKLVTQNVSNAKPDLIISQEICEVCSAYTNQVKNAIEILDEKPEIYSMSPHDIQGILKCVDDIAEKIDEVKRGNEIVNSLNSRIEEIKNVKNDPRWNQLKAVKERKVFAVDANSFFSKPSIRVVTGIEILAKILHPEMFEELEVPNNSFLKI